MFFQADVKVPRCFTNMYVLVYNFYKGYNKHLHLFLSLSLSLSLSLFIYIYTYIYVCVWEGACVYQRLRVNRVWRKINF